MSNEEKLTPEQQRARWVEPYMDRVAVAHAALARELRDLKHITTIHDTGPRVARCLERTQINAEQSFLWFREADREIGEQAK